MKRTLKGVGPISALPSGINLFGLGDLGGRPSTPLIADPLGGAARMTSKAEQLVSRCLRSVVAARADGEQIEESSEFEELQSALELFLPTVLRESYPVQWRHESLDGFRLPIARKTGPSEAELLGLCLLISDQTWTPVHVHIRASADADTIPWVLCRVGSRVGAGPEFTRLPYESTKVSKLLYSVAEQPENIAWAFTVERAAEARRPTRQ